MIAGSCATNIYKLRQVRKEAAVVNHFVCRRGAWLSPKFYDGILRCSKHFFDNSTWADTQVCPYRANSKGRDESHPYTAEFASVSLR